MLFLKLLLRRRWIWCRLLRVGIRVAMMRCCDDEDVEMLTRTYCYIVVQSLCEDGNYPHQRKSIENHDFSSFSPVRSF
jgi:hypothetical protein